RALVFQSDLRMSSHSQTPLARASTSTHGPNVDRVRERGVELAFSGQDVAIKGLDVDANVSATKAHTLADAAKPNYDVA
ncbi:hypothetical protein AAHH79_41435, partial [Burkholderia pseudomallei]